MYNFFDKIMYKFFVNLKKIFEILFHLKFKSPYYTHFTFYLLSVYSILIYKVISTFWNFAVRSSQYEEIFLNQSQLSKLSPAKKFRLFNKLPDVRWCSCTWPCQSGFCFRSSWCDDQSQGRCTVWPTQNRPCSRCVRGHEKDVRPDNFQALNKTS